MHVARCCRELHSFLTLPDNTTISAAIAALVVAETHAAFPFLLIEQRGLKQSRLLGSPSHLSQKSPNQLEARIFLRLYRCIKIALLAIVELLGKSPLNLPTAHCPRNYPATSPCVDSVMHAIEPLLHWSRAEAEFMNPMPLWLASAFFEFPAVQLRFPVTHGSLLGPPSDPPWQELSRRDLTGMIGNNVPFTLSDFRLCYFRGEDIRRERSKKTFEFIRRARTCICLPKASEKTF